MSSAGQVVVCISEMDKASQLSNASEITITLSSPSQKLWQSSQESECPDPSKETMFCEEIDSVITIDGDDVQLPKEIFDRLVSKVSAMCDLKAEVKKLRTLCTEKFGKRGTLVSDPQNFRKLCTEAGADKIFDFILNAMETDRQSSKRKGFNELRATPIIYTLIYGQSQQANWSL